MSISKCDECIILKLYRIECLDQAPLMQLGMQLVTQIGYS